MLISYSLLFLFYFLDFPCKLPSLDRAEVNAFREAEAQVLVLRPPAVVSLLASSGGLRVMVGPGMLCLKCLAEPAGFCFVDADGELRPAPPGMLPLVCLGRSVLWFSRF